MKNISKIVFGVLAAGLFLLQPSLSYADWHGRGNDHHGHWGHRHHRHYNHDHWNHGSLTFRFSTWPKVYYAPSYYVRPAYVAAPYEPVVYQSVPTAVATATTNGYFTINVPNNRGGYTSVDLKRIETGFLGPQGEFYAEFPRVSQLQAIYGR